MREAYLLLALLINGLRNSIFFRTSSHTDYFFALKKGATDFFNKTLRKKKEKLPLPIEPGIILKFLL
jgi:penicillin-binding protein-related factor A (putative recombinase)